MKKISYIFILAAFIYGCGQPQESQTTQQPEVEEIPSYQTGDTIFLVATGANMGEMKFDKKEIYVPAETEITMALINKSTDPTMPHNVVIIENGKSNDVGQAGLNYKDNSYVMPNDINVFAHSPLAQIGETVYFSFKTPSSGEYQFICSYPGHWGLMKGDFIVE